MNPFMLAIEKGHVDVAKAMVEIDPCLVSLKLSSGLSMTQWAKEKGHDAFFKVCIFFLVAIIFLTICD